MRGNNYLRVGRVLREWQSDPPTDPRGFAGVGGVGVLGVAPRDATHQHRRETPIRPYCQTIPPAIPPHTPSKPNTPYLLNRPYPLQKQPRAKTPPSTSSTPLYLNQIKYLTQPIIYTIINLI